MTSFIYAVLFLFGLFLPVATPWAQSNCPADFAQMEARCINATFKDAKFKFPKNQEFTLNSELKDDIFFYTTAGGSLGKLHVLSTLKNKNECVFYLDAITYGNQDRAFAPNSSIKISSEDNWQVARIYLDKEGSSALELVWKNIEKDKTKKANNQCVIMVTKGVQIAKVRDIESDNVQIWKQSYDLLYYAPLVLIFIAIFIIVRVFMEEQDKFKTQEALEDAENTAKVKNQPLFLKVTRPFYKRYFLPMTQGKNKQKYRTKYRQKIANAGMSKDITPEEFMALKFFMILGGPFAFLTVRFIMEETWSLSITPVMGLVGYLYPDIWLSGLIQKRTEEILRAMPFIVDMLALSVEAGLDFMAAIQRVIEKAPPSALNDEFETLVRETRIGSSRAEGLRQLGWRVNIIEINSFCATLIAADSVGASIGPLLKQLSSELRVKRSARAEQAGATAATKILIPMIFFILPAVLVAIFAPMVLKMMSGEM
jgi:tight adherence protein C